MCDSKTNGVRLAHIPMTKELRKVYEGRKDCSNIFPTYGILLEKSPYIDPFSYILHEPGFARTIDELGRPFQMLDTFICKQQSTRYSVLGIRQ
jgi:hypothetical protein